MAIWTGIRGRERRRAGAVVPLPRAAEPRRRHVWVLSGGGARGAAQVGAMGALLDAGIVPDAIVGCSVGALNAAFVAGGPTPQRVEALAERWSGLGRADVFGGGRIATVRHVVVRRTSLFPPDPLARLVDAWLPAPTFEELAVPLRVVTTSLTSGRPVYHDRGPLRDVLLASAALPGLLPPVILPSADGRPELHVDGGVTDLVPLAGALAGTPGEPTDVWVLDVTAAPGTGAFRVRSALDVLVASLTTSMRARPLPDLPGVTVHHLGLRGEDTGPGGLMDFSRTAELIASGRERTRARLAPVEVRLPEAV